MAALLGLLALLSGAAAQQVAMEPQNRLHAGVSVAPGAGPGIAAGLDSRMMRLLYVDAGFFASPVHPAAVGPAPEAPGSTFVVRHALTVAPGFRLPHRGGDAVQWDAALRAGFAVVWALDAATDDVQVGPGLLGGGDALLRSGAWGVRGSLRAVAIRPYSRTSRDEVTVVRPVGALEVLVQW